MNRREFLRTAGGATGAAAALGASGTATAQETGTGSTGTTEAGNGTTESGNGTDGGGGGGGTSGQPDYGTWFSDVGNYDDETVDMRGQSEVTVTVGAQGNGGALAFDPPAIHVDTGTTVLFEWTGEGGTHNVVADDESYESGTAVGGSGVNFEYTYEEAGISKYYCNPHLTNGMKGAVVVGDEYPTNQPGVATPVNPEHVGVPFQAHWVGISTIVAIFVSLMFTFYTLKYGESPNTKGGND